MAITLDEVRMNTGDKLTASVIDEFRRQNFILNNILFDDTVLPASNGAALSYSYFRIVSRPTAAFRAIGSEYTPSNATKKKVTVDLKAFGGAFEIDRMLASAGGFVNEVDVQAHQMISAAQTLFNNALINGDTSSDSKAFDGLDKALSNSSTEYNKSGTAVDLTDSGIDTNYKKFLDMLDEFILSLDGRPSAILGNTRLIARLRACARRAGSFNQTVDDFGRQAIAYDGIPLVDMGDASEDTPIIGTSSNVTSLYAVRLGLDGLHAVSMNGQSPIRVWMPNFETAGAVKRGEVEMTAAIALKSTRSAGVFRNIKV